MINNSSVADELDALAKFASQLSRDLRRRGEDLDPLVQAGVLVEVAKLHQKLKKLAAKLPEPDLFTNGRK